MTFHYPNSEKAILRDFSLDIPAGKIVAIVGPNGAGKSSLLKLICRFYDPTEGRVTLDGVDLKAISVDELRQQITVLFQFPLYYFAPARDSIALGDLTARNDAARVQQAAEVAGAHDFIQAFPQGYETLLGKSLGGEELSGGQWQRLSMARAYFRDASIVLLDEPTSFMDSWAEVAWFDGLRILARGKTVIMITHRFTIAMRADIIHVMDEGRIVESGSHRELIERGGLYARSWNAQMSPADNRHVPTPT